MHAYMIEEMTDAISQGLRVDNHAVLLVLQHYWEDKIALTWHVEDMLQAALNVGKPKKQPPLNKDYGKFCRKIRLWRVCKTWYQATLVEAGTEHQSAFEQI